MEIKELLDSKRVVITDGSMGTYLQQKGCNAETPEMANLQHRELVRDIHSEYIRAGAQIIVTNTFGANRLRLTRKNLQSSLHDINSSAAKIASEASKTSSGTMVAGDIGPTGEILEPYGDMQRDSAFETFSEQADILDKGGVDFLLLETFQDLEELKIAYRAATEKTGKTALPSFSFSSGREFRTMMGNSIEEIIAWAESENLEILGINCGLKSGETIPLVEKFLSLTGISIWIKPNAGMPHVKEGVTSYPETPEEFSRNCSEMALKGVRFIGGCCGTTPGYISALAKRIDEIS